MAQFAAAMDGAGLTEVGESFLLRGGFDAGEAEVGQAKVVTTAARVKNREPPPPLADPAAPVELEVRYDGRPVTPEIRHGKAFILEPRERQTVSFVLRRKGGGKERCGAVLKVDGESTPHHQRLAEPQCLKWILEPGSPPITISGFQTDDGKAQAFRILSRAESKAREMDYGADVGTISLVVFGERKGKAAPPDVSEEAEDLAALSREAYPAERPRMLAALQEQLREDAGRGLIAEGEEIKSDIRHVKFEPGPTPVLLATITYYRP